MEDLASLSFVADLERENLVLRDEVLKLKLRIAELLAAQRESLSRDLMAMSDVDDEQKILSLNVGGTIFATLRSTLLQHEGTFFEALFSGRHSNLIKDEQGNYFIDRDPTFFQDILNILRNPTIPIVVPQQEVARDAFFAELDYYGLLPIIMPKKATDKLREWVVDFQESCGLALYHKKAAELYLESTAGNEGERLYQEALRYDLGDVDEQHDYEKAVQLYHQAAEMGHVEAQYNLGICYQEGDGVEQDNEKAFRFYLRAANQMHKQAQYYVGLFYKEGKGVDQNIYEAIHWFRKAAGQGHTVAQAFLLDDSWQVKNKDVCGW